LIAYILSPRSQKHPYLLWTSLFVAASGVTDLLLPAPKKTITSVKSARQKKGKGRQMDASYEVLGASDRESEASSEEMEDDFNGEEVRQEMEGFMWTQIIRTCVAGTAFAMSVVGIWGDGAADLVVIEM
jgi:autophagy-related protein 33